MDGYYDTLDKVALAVESAKIAKSVVVQQDGIGEDLSFNLMAWSDDELCVVAQLSQSFMSDHEDRFARLIQAACILRQGWRATAFTLVAEGYCSTDASGSKGKDLAQLFSSPSADFVKECLSFTHVEDEDVLFVAVPYTYFPPRLVEFGGALQHRGVGVLRDPRYPMALLRALDLDIERDEDEIDLDEDILRAVLAEGVRDLGFEIHYR